MALAVFCVSIFSIWMTPLLLAGFPYNLSGTVHTVHAFVETGVLNPAVTLFTLLLWVFHPFIGWENVMGWAAVSAGFFAAALIPFWWSICRLFNVRIAWIATVIFGLMPMYWAESVYLGSYTAAFFFMFLGSAFFLAWHERRPWIAIFLAGTCYGFTLATHHTFITFLPWFLLLYVIYKWQRWRSAIFEAGVFCIVAFVAFVVPLAPNALQEGLSPVERIMVFIPSAGDHAVAVYHLYPDEFTYTFLREEFIAEHLRDVEQSSLLGRQDNQNYRYVFGLGDTSLFAGIKNGIWLFLNAIPRLFLQETIGGIFLWLFILPGMIIVGRTRPRILISMIGLWFCMQFILRFGFHYSRDHLLDVGWALAIFAAVGVSWVASSVHEQVKRIPAGLISLFILIAISLQFVQGSRMLFARLYAKSNTPEAYAAAQALDEIPSDAVIAYPRNAAKLLYFSDHESVVLHDWTLQYLASKDRLQEPFAHYGITHIIGYTLEDVTRITEAVPGVRNIEFHKGDFSVPLTPFIRLLLHVIR